MNTPKEPGKTSARTMWCGGKENFYSYNFIQATYMTRNIWIGIVVVIVLVAGGWWYLNQSSAPATSETTQLPTAQQKTNPGNSTASNPTTQPASNCVVQDKFKPLITSIVPSSGPVGTRVQINGCNLSGFEADLNATFARSDGAIIPLYGGTLYRKNIEAAEPQSMAVTFQTYCPSGSVIGLYSGLEQKCTTVEATPGVYQVYVVTPEGTSNTVSFTAH